MRCFATFICFITIAINALAQERVIDSVMQALTRSNDDGVRFRLLVRAGEYYAFNNTDSCIFYTKEAMTLAENRKNELWKAHANIPLSYYFFVSGDIASALETAFKNLHNYPRYRDASVYAGSTTFIGILYLNNGNYKEAISYAAKSLKLCNEMELVNDVNSIHINSTKEALMIEDYMVLSTAKLHFNKIDSALFYAQKAYDLDMKHQLNNNYPLYRLALVYSKAGNTEMALSLFRRAVSRAYSQDLLKDVLDNYNGMAEAFKITRQTDSAIFYASKAMQSSKMANYKKGALEASLLLSEIYEQHGKKEDAFRYYKYAMSVKDSLFNQQKVQQVQNIAFKEELKEREFRQKIANEQSQYRNRIRLYVLIGIAIIFFSITLLLYRNNRQKQKAKLEIEKAYNELKATQAQLIQQEKMASLGELTAGIAHEIQNPLNFVNNFSEVNTELLGEMREEIENGNWEDVKAIASDVINNNSKINNHGRRADGIVKGMLEHSRTSKGQKQPTDINILADEYIRLAYHGFRANYQSFSAAIETHFDDRIGKVGVISKDIGRVLLNLFNNAFYAVTEKKKQLNGAFEPLVVVTTERANDTIQIRVKDNGLGIQRKAADKIFQPFFTTKPTGQGTGLGLSLSYDIIKAHGGEIKVESKEGEGAEFTVALPYQ
jgi:signal transduction histidine kinase